jgi:RNA polymerase sigma factor (sigma-70 family)
VVGVVDGVRVVVDGQDASPGTEDHVRVESIEELFRAEYAATVKLAHLLTGDGHAAEDLAQDAFARVRPQLARVDNAAAYLRTVTVNVCRNWHRRRSRESATLRLHGVSVESVSGEAAELLDVVDRLPFRQRTVLVLRYWHDASEAEIAKSLGCRPGTVKSLHSRAMQQLRREVPR